MLAGITLQKAWDLVHLLWSNWYYCFVYRILKNIGVEGRMVKTRTYNSLFSCSIWKVKMTLTAPKVLVRGRRWALVLKNSLLTLFFCIGKEGSLIPTYRKGWRLNINHNISISEENIPESIVHNFLLHFLKPVPGLSGTNNGGWRE